MRDTIRLLLNDRELVLEGVPASQMLLPWLRTARALTGAKEGCAEGDCGACTVVVGELVDPETLPRLRTVNACLQFMHALDGKAVFTVEYLRAQTGGELHPVQRALVEHHASQCGFCTPGFVMSLWTLYNDTVQHAAQENAEPCRVSLPPRGAETGLAVSTGHSDQDVALVSPPEARLRSVLTGNLCRCTGYRPILAAAQHMFTLPPRPFNRLALRNRLQSLRTSLAAEPPGVESASPPSAGGNGPVPARFHAPRTLAELTRLRADKPDATVLAGGTDIGLWVNKALRPLGEILYVGGVDTLKTITTDDQRIVIGAAVSLTDAWDALVTHYPALAEMRERFASVPIRNAGTLGGNIANGSPIGDSMPALIALGAEVALVSVRGWRRLALEALYLDYMRKDLADDELVAHVEVPLPGPDLRFRSYKLSKRFDSDISAVCTGFAISLDGRRIASARIAFGGMAATCRRAPATEDALTGHEWTADTLEAACAALARDFAPLDDLRASADYRLRAAANLLRRFFLETRPDAPLPPQAVNVFALDVLSDPMTSPLNAVSSERPT